MLPSWPVVEVFGPTIQGEGPLAGARTMFVRFGGCDYRCSWCDSLFAVLPEHWSRTAPRMRADEVIAELRRTLAHGNTGAVPWVTLSGGNPALYDLGMLVNALHSQGYKVAVETQASRWRPWLTWVDALVCSPKPPSSGMASELHMRKWRRFCEQAVRTAKPGTLSAVKVVVFDNEDYEWAVDVLGSAPAGWQRWLSVGTDPPAEWEQQTDTVRYLCERWAWLAEKVAGDARLGDARVLPQCHVLAWGHARGV